MSRIASLMAGALALAACVSSPETTFVTLEPSSAPGPAPAEAATAGPDVTLEIGEIRLPAILDRRDLVRQGPAGEVLVAPAAQWAAPLESLVREVLARDLAGRLRRTRVVLPGEPRPEGDLLSLYLVVGTFAPGADGRVRLHARWGVAQRAQAGPFDFATELPTGDATAPAVARAMSAALAELSAAIARRLPSGALSGKEGAGGR